MPDTCFDESRCHSGSQRNGEWSTIPTPWVRVLNDKFAASLIGHVHGNAKTFVAISAVAPLRFARQLPDNRSVIDQSLTVDCSLPTFFQSTSHTASKEPWSHLSTFAFDARLVEHMFSTSPNDDILHLSLTSPQALRLISGEPLLGATDVGRERSPVGNGFPKLNSRNRPRPSPARLSKIVARGTRRRRR